MGKTEQSGGEMLKGTLDMMVLRTLATGDAHGHTIAKVIERTSEHVLEVEQGTLYPALHRLEDRGWVTSYWGASENNRKAKFYRLTIAGKSNLSAKRTAGGRWIAPLAWSWAERLRQMEVSYEVVQVLSPATGGCRVAAGNRSLFG